MAEEKEQFQEEKEVSEEGQEEAKPPEVSVDELRKELQEAKKEAQEHYDRLLRVYAEFENYKKRVAREKSELVRYGNEDLLKEILPILDNLERALEHASQGEGKGIREGVELVLAQFRQVLQRFGVIPISAVGEAFDPERHEAVMEEESDEVEPGHIISEIEKGYMLNDRLLRPAKVIVAKAKEEEGGPSD